MNRREILSSLASWATAASAIAASDATPLPATVEGWPKKELADDHPLRPVFSDDERVLERLRIQSTTVLPMDVRFHHVQPEKTLLVFRMTQCVNQEMVESLRSNIRSWVRDSRIDCAAILLPYGLELDVHRIPADTSPADGSVSPKE